MVDDLAEQALLEEMLENNKPPAPVVTAQLHYLLSTLFRYPPLRHGSRYGNRFEPSLFYGSASLQPALAETAFYRLHFLSGMATPPPSAKLTTEHTIFAASYAVEYGLKLQNPPCNQHAEILTNPVSYDQTQQLGSGMREAEIGAFQFTSARDLSGGVNVALFSPAAFKHTQPLWQQHWLCETQDESIAFFNKETGSFLFPRNQFEINGVLPYPAF